mmetsp:Transcript_5226/g.7563  ORF Transcript_5226/g.7563 Transcript_5226/m.7563 type:complete len:474 (+) Transcript_5226:1-1422(+)
MGFALRTDTKNPDQGVFIEKPQLESQDSIAHVLNSDDPEHAEEMLSLLAEKSGLDSKGTPGANAGSKSSMLTSAPFLSKVIMYLERHNVPFEHVDLWVPSFIPDPDSIDGGTICRLCHAGSATTDNQVKADGKTVVPLSGEEHFMLQAFGDYSQKFSFDVGCGLPGRIYQSGLPTWEQNVQNAPHNHFERCGGAKQWEIKTVVGIPIASPNVGRIVATLYSREDRPKNQELVGRLSDEFTRLMPSPKWKLVVDIGEPEPLNHVSSSQNLAASDVAEIISVTSPVIQSTTHNSENTIHTVTASPTMSFTPRDTRSEQVVSLLGEFMPSDPSSPLVSYLPGFMSLRLMLLRQNRSHEEEETMRIVLDSFASYSAGGRARNDIALMLARDYMFLTQHQEQRQHHSSLSPMMGAQQPPAHSLSSNQMPQSSSQTPSSGYWMQISPNNGPMDSFHKSPSLAPIGGQGNTMDSMNLIST